MLRQLWAHWASPVAHSSTSGRERGGHPSRLGGAPQGGASVWRGPCRGAGPRRPVPGGGPPHALSCLPLSVPYPPASFGCRTTPGRRGHGCQSALWGPSRGAQALPAASGRGLCLPKPAVPRLCPPHSDQRPCPGPRVGGASSLPPLGQRDKTPASQYWHAAITLAIATQVPPTPATAWVAPPTILGMNKLTLRPPARCARQATHTHTGKPSPNASLGPAHGHLTGLTRTPPQGCRRRAACPREKRGLPGSESVTANSEQRRPLQPGAVRGGAGPRKGRPAGVGVILTPHDDNHRHPGNRRLRSHRTRVTPPPLLSS